MKKNDIKQAADGLAIIGKVKKNVIRRSLAIGAVIAGTLLGTVAVHAADLDTDRSRPMTFVQDSVITTKVKAKLASDQMSTLARIKVDTDRNGLVVLSGSVKSQEEADKAIQIAQNTEGVTAVKSQLEIKKE